jgi:hypothetical protein
MAIGGPALEKNEKPATHEHKFTVTSFPHEKTPTHSLNNFFQRKEGKRQKRMYRYASVFAGGHRRPQDVQWRKVVFYTCGSVWRGNWGQEKKGYGGEEGEGFSYHLQDHTENPNWCAFSITLIHRYSRREKIFVLISILSQQSTQGRHHKMKKKAESANVRNVLRGKPKEAAKLGSFFLFNI